MRSVAAVIAGYATMVVAVTTFFSFIVYVALGGMPSDPKAFTPPVWLYVVELATTPILAGLGGYVCAWIARRREMHHALALAVVLAVGGIVTTLVEPGPAWHGLALGALGVLGVPLGARLRIAHRDAVT